MVTAIHPNAFTRNISRENVLDAKLVDLAKLEAYIPQYNRPHRLDIYTLVFVKKVLGFVSIDTNKYTINAPTILIIPPGKIRSFNWQNKPVGISLFFNPELMLLGSQESFKNLLMLQYGQVFVKKLKKQEEVMFQKTISLIGDQFGANPIHKSKVIHHLINSLLIQLEVFKKDINIQPSGRGEEILYKYEQLINERFLKMKKPNEYARELGVSTNHLNKLVNTIYGKTSSQLISERIILEAKRLLTHTNHTVSHIADVLSFEYLSYFIRFFKKNVGFTPEEYRRKINL